MNCNGSASVRVKAIIAILPENGYRNFVCPNGVIINWERYSLTVRKDLSDQLSGSLLSLYSFSKD
jgi:hypothetical protein